MSPRFRRAAVGALGSTRDPEDDDHARRFVDEVGDPEVADTETPEVGAGELQDSRQARVDSERQDRSTEARGVTRWEPSKLALRCGGEFDAATAFVHALSGS